MTDRPPFQASAPVAGRFTLIDRIGGGASGTVWRAFDHRRGDYCAAKVVEQGDVRTLLRVAREQGVRLTHPHVVSPYGWAADDSVLIAMDLVRGGSLTTLIGDYGPLPSHFVARILGQLLSALGHIHDTGLLHRDVKPPNVLLDVTGLGPPHARLGDFGLAMPADGPRLTQTGYVVGTRGYLPPEALQGALPNLRRDLFASGVVGWQMLTGSERPPAEPVKGPPPFEADPALWVFVRTLMSPLPEARPPDAKAAGRELHKIIRRLPASAPARTRDGESIEVFDVVGPLPDHARGPRPPTPPA